MRVLFGADDGGEESDKGGGHGEGRPTPGRVVLHAPAEGGQVGQGTKAPPRGSRFVNSTERLNVQWQGKARADHFNDALPRPHGELGAEGDLSGLVALLAGVVRAPGGAEGKVRLGHRQLATDEGRRSGVKGAQAEVPGGSGAEDRHDVAFWVPEQLDIGGEEAGG